MAEAPMLEAQASMLEAQAWMRRARDDLGAAHKLLKGDDPFPATAAYHCQQATEKALKALLALTGEPIPKTHDLRVLLERCTGIDPALGALADACDELTPYATEFRYPADTADPDREQVCEALALCRDAIAAIALRIGETATENASGDRA